MKLLHIINNLEVGGAQKLVHDLALIQNEDPQFEVKIFVFQLTNSQIEKSLKEKGVEIISSHKAPFSFTTIRQLKSLIKNTDVVHAHLFPTNYLTALLSFITNASPKFIFTEHSTHNRRRNHKILSPIERLIYKRYHTIACISDATALNLTKWIGEKVARSRITIIENGIDTDQLMRATPVNSKILFGREGKALLMISRLSPAKDHSSVIKALKYIEDPNIFVVFAGDGELRNDLEQMAKNCGVEQRIIFLGTREDIPQLIKGAYLGIQASNWEGFGITAIELMAGGLPLIASDVAGLRDVVGDAAILFPKNDYKSLAQAIQLLIHDKEMYDNLREKGLQRAALYSIEATAEKYKRIYLN